MPKASVKRKRTSSIKSGSNCRKPRTKSRKRSNIKRKSSNSKTTEIVEVDNEQKNNSVNNLLNKQKKALIWFYADWCGHCQQMKPEWEKFEDKCKKLKGNRMVVKVNSDFQPKLTENLSAIANHVEGYPTILTVKGNRIQKYNGPREHNNLLNYLRHM